MASKRVIVDQIEIQRDGNIGVRFIKQIIDDDGSEISSQPHRVTLEPGNDLEFVMNQVNAHLQVLKFPAVDAAEYAQLAPYIGIKWTPEIVAASDERKKVAREALEKKTKEGKGDAVELPNKRQ